jgi:hypothetical protein
MGDFDLRGDPDNKAVLDMADETEKHGRLTVGLKAAINLMGMHKDNPNIASLVSEVKSLAKTQEFEFPPIVLTELDALVTKQKQTAATKSSAASAASGQKKTKKDGAAKAPSVGPSAKKAKKL